MRTSNLVKKIYYGFPLPISPKDLRAYRDGHKVLANSMPKSGTHLLTRFLSLLPYFIPRWSFHVNESTPNLEERIKCMRNGQYASAHLYWSEPLARLLTNHNVKTLFILRDPRDIAVSNVYYITHTQTNHRLTPFMLSLDSAEERLMASIAGIDGQLLPDGIRSKSIPEHLCAFMPWLKDSSCLAVRFEDLIGARGGGDSGKQYTTVRSMLTHMGINLPEGEIRRVAEQTFFKGSPTFRKGAIGDWRNHFTEKHKRVFKELGGDLLIQLGYESGYDW